MIEVNLFFYILGHRNACAVVNLFESMAINAISALRDLGIEPFWDLDKIKGNGEGAGSDVFNTALLQDCNHVKLGENQL